MGEKLNLKIRSRLTMFFCVITLLAVRPASASFSKVINETDKTIVVKAVLHGSNNIGDQFKVPKHSSVKHLHGTTGTFGIILVWPLNDSNRKVQCYPGPSGYNPTDSKTTVTQDDKGNLVLECEWSNYAQD